MLWFCELPNVLLCDLQKVVFSKLPIIVFLELPKVCPFSELLYTLPFESYHKCQFLNATKCRLLGATKQLTNIFVSYKIQFLGATVGFMLKGNLTEK